MIIGFVLISTEPTKEYDVYQGLLKVPEIIYLHPILGEYDLIAKIEAKDFVALGEIIIKKIRSIQGVVDTRTLTGTTRL